VLSSPAVRPATVPEEHAIISAMEGLPNDPSFEVVGDSYIGPVAVLRVGGALTRGNWAIAESRHYLQYHKGSAIGQTVLHKTSRGWQVNDLAGGQPGCNIPEEVLIAFALNDVCH
jgi:hypothetical protein